MLIYVCFKSKALFLYFFRFTSDLNGSSVYLFAQGKSQKSEIPHIRCKVELAKLTFNPFVVISYC